MNKLKNRNSNIELLRIVLILMVIVLHFNNANMGGAFRYSQGINELVLRIFESVCICAVNVFVIISGYFMIYNDRRNTEKPLNLLISVSFYQVVLYAFFCAIGRDAFDVAVFIKKCIPMNWYIILYCSLYMVSPLLNNAIRSLDEKKQKQYLIILFVLFSVVMSGIDFIKEILHFGTIPGLSTISMYDIDAGYTLVQFCMMYYIGAYLRLHPIHDFSHQKTGFVFIIISIVMSLLSYKCKAIWNYNNVLVVINSVLLFLIFANWELKYNRIINTLSKGVLGIYISHAFLYGFVWSFMNIADGVSGDVIYMIIYVMFCTLLLAAISYIVNLIGGFCLKYITKIIHILHMDIEI